MKKILLITSLLICSLCFGQVKYQFYQKKNLVEDLQFFAEKLTFIHPAFLDKTLKDKWLMHLTTAKGQLKDSMTQNEFFMVVAPLMADINDSHSNFLCPYDQRKQYMMSGGLSFPFAVDLKDNAIFVRAYFGDDSTLFKYGEEIISINGIQSSEITEMMRKLSGGNSKALKNYAIETDFRNYIWMIFHFEKDYEMIIRDNAGNQRKVSVKGITNNQYIKHRNRNPQSPDKRYSLVTDVAGSTSILTIRSFADLEGFCKFADSVFPLIVNNNIQNLVIDVRNNGGGRSVVVDSLMNFLTNKKYSQYLKVETRISNDLKERYKIKYPDRFEEIKNYPLDSLLVEKDDLVKPHTNKPLFRNNLYLLINNLTASGAATFAGLFKEMKLGKIIGEESGGTIGYYGDYWFHSMPVTGLQFFVSPKYFVQFGGKVLTKGVEPDYVVKDEGDAVIEFTKRIIYTKTK